MQHFTKIPNKLLESLYTYDFSKREIKIILALTRETSGFHRKQKQISLDELATRTKIDRAHVSRTLHELQQKQVIEINKNAGSSATFYHVQNPEKWSVDNLGSRLPNQQQGVAERATLALPKEQHYCCQKSNTTPSSLKKRLKETLKERTTLERPQSNGAVDNSKKSEAAEEPKTPFWQELIDHLKGGWERKFKRPMPEFENQDLLGRMLRDLKQLCKHYGVFGVMALWDYFLEDYSAPNARLPYTIFAKYRLEKRLLDLPWKERAIGYKNKLEKPVAAPADPELSKFLSDLSSKLKSKKP